MLSTEFIPTSSSDEDFLRNNTPKPCNDKNSTEAFADSATKNTSGPAAVSVAVGKTSNFTTNPEGIKFVPQPSVFYYSLQVKKINAEDLKFLI